MDILTNVSLTRDNHCMYTLQVGDESSNTPIVKIRLTGEQFAFMVTGMYMSELKAECSNHLDRVGKKKIRESRSVVFPKDYPGNREDKELFIRDTCQESGWIVDSYLRSQSSVSYKGGETILNYSVYKFVSE